MIEHVAEEDRYKLAAGIRSIASDNGSGRSGLMLLTTKLVNINLLAAFECHSSYRMVVCNAELIYSNASLEC